MGEAGDIRAGLFRRKLSYGEFAERCGMSEVVLRESLRGGDVGDDLRTAYASLEVEGVTRADAPMAPMGHARACVSGKLVRNDTIMFVNFPDGTTGLVRKKKDFKPKEGLPMEVEETDESGGWRVVGDYRRIGGGLG